MRKPDIPANESERQKVLDALDIVYSPAEERFNKITRIAKRLFDTPISLISLVTEDKQWFKSCQGLTTSETSREISFCGHAINHDDVFVIPNASRDPDFNDNPLVTGEPHIRFYAGQPLTIEGQRIGTLCIIDQKPRQLKPRDYDSLKSLASWIESEIMSWKTNKGSMIDAALSIENREAYFDDLTGNFNSSILDKLLIGLSNLQNNSSDVAQRFKVELEGLPAADNPNRQQKIIKDVSQTLHRVLGGNGILAFDGDHSFTIIQYISAAQQDDPLAPYQRSLAEEFATIPTLKFNISAI